MRMAVLVLAAVIGAGAALSGCNKSGADAKVTPANGAAVKIGMTAAQVDVLLGSGGKDVPEADVPEAKGWPGLRWRRWDAEKYSAVVGFSPEGKVAADYDVFR